MIRVFFLGQCQSWKRWRPLCFAITRCGKGQSVCAVDRRETGTSSGGWLAALASSFCFFRCHSPFVRSCARLATRLDASTCACRRACRGICGCVFRWPLACSRQVLWEPAAELLPAEQQLGLIAKERSRSLQAGWGGRCCLPAAAERTCARKTESRRQQQPSPELRAGSAARCRARIEGSCIRAWAQWVSCVGALVHARPKIS